MPVTKSGPTDLHVPKIAYGTGFSSEVPKRWGAHPDAFPGELHVEETLSLNEMWTKNKIYILAGNLLS
jgi:hypothetical protein